MSEPKSPPPGEHGQILPFVRPGRIARHGPFTGWLGRPTTSPVSDIGKYERPDSEPDDYRHRMTVNAAAFGFCALLVVIGIWLAIKIAELRRDQDCVLSGRRNCAQISISNLPR